MTNKDAGEKIRRYWIRKGKRNLWIDIFSNVVSIHSKTQFHDDDVLLNDRELKKVLAVLKTIKRGDKGA